MCFVVHARTFREREGESETERDEKVPIYFQDNLPTWGEEEEEEEEQEEEEEEEEEDHKSIRISIKPIAQFVILRHWLFLWINIETDKLSCSAL